MRNDQNEHDRDATILGNDTPRVAPLSDLDDFQVADGCPDVRGWDVVGADGRKVGTVHELIADTGAMRVRYLDVKLDHTAAGSQGDHDVLVPIGTARLDENDDRVMLDSATASRIGTLPAYAHGQVTREHENRLLPALGITAAGADADFYAGKHFDDRQFYANRRTPSADEGRHITRSEEELEIGKREVRAGEVDVRKHVETEHVKRPVTVRHEDVTIERRPVDASSRRSAAKIGEEEIRVPIVEEEAVVEKRPVVKEEVVIKKHAVNETQQVEADLRKERIDVDRERTKDDHSRDAR